MITKSIFRSSMLLLISGILIAVSMLFHPDVSRIDSALQGSWIVVHVLLGIAALLSILGLAGLYSPMRIKMILFGQFAFGLAILGNILLAGLMFFVEATLVPVLAGNPAYQPLLSDSGPLMTGFFGFAITASLVIAALGWVFLGAYLAATKTISTANGLLFLGAPLMLLSPPLPLTFGMLGGVLFGSGLTWLGISIRRGVAYEALRETLRLEDECLIQAGGHA